MLIIYTLLGIGANSIPNIFSTVTIPLSKAFDVSS
jgi:hypothetical protein